MRSAFLIATGLFVFLCEYLRGVNLIPAAWTFSDSYEEHNKIYRDIFWKAQ